jgi:hypothetical protein
MDAFLGGNKAQAIICLGILISQESIRKSKENPHSVDIQ